MIVEPMDGAARDAQCLSRSNVNRLSLDSPRQDSLEAINRFLHDIEREGAAELGARQFPDLKALLTRVWQSPLAW
jgi:hypothetical protein